MERYPFVIAKRKSVVIHASSYANALDRVLYKYRNKFVKTTYAKNVAKHQKTMDLINAQKDAKAQSKAKKDQLVYVILEADEFIIKDFMQVKEKDDVYSIWRNGAKYEDMKVDDPAPMKVTKRPLTAAQAQPEKNESQKTENKMETKKKVAPKKAAKKVAAKVAKKSPAKKLTPKTARNFEPGKVVKISIGDMIKNMKKGFYYRDPQGVRQTEKYMKSRSNQEYVREGMHEYKEA